MLELFAIEQTTNVLANIITRIVALLNWFAGHSDRIDVRTQQTTNSERMGGT